MKSILTALGSFFVASQSWGMDVSILPYSSRGAQFLAVRYGSLPEFSSNTFNADFFPTANLPLGTTTGCDLNGGVTVNQLWPGQTDLLVVKPFLIVSGVTNVRVLAAVDDRVQVWVNGVEVSKGMEIADACPRLDQFLFKVPDGILKYAPEQNVIKVRARDHGGANYINIRAVGAAPDGLTAFAQEQISFEQQPTR